MRELVLRQTAANLLKQAQAAAVKAIGLRGEKAQKAMQKGAREIRLRQEDERWGAIVRGARRSWCDVVSEVELGLVDASTTSDGSTETPVDA